MISTKTIPSLLIIVGCLCLPACQWEAGNDSTVQRNTANPVIGHLETKDKLITIRESPDGPLYTVKSEDGKILARDLAADDVGARFPELKPLIWAGTDDAEHPDSN